MKTAQHSGLELVSFSECLSPFLPNGCMSTDGEGLTQSVLTSGPLTEWMEKEDQLEEWPQDRSDSATEKAK